MDLVWHECEFPERSSFSYVIRNTEGDYLLACATSIPGASHRAPSEALMGHDGDVSWGVTADAYETPGTEGFESTALGHRGLPFTAPYWSNREIPGLSRRPVAGPVIVAFSRFQVGMNARREAL